MKKRWLRRIARAGLALCLCMAGLAAWLWAGSTQHVMRSQALGEARSYRVFNASPTGRIVYALDGHSLRNSLAPAVLFSLSAWLRGEHSPTIVAVDSTASRDRDFRPEAVTPTAWRPDIEGRSGRFDTFLLDELAPALEDAAHRRRSRYVMGHSLAGLYVLDLASRRPQAFDGFFAFAPTFSHDTSIASRLPRTCEARLVYANWGLESRRDTTVWTSVTHGWLSHPLCAAGGPVAVRHPGSLHQTIMLTGQLHLALRGLD